MLIAIDARCLESQRGGVARYLVNMLRLWPELGARHRYILYFAQAVPADDFLRRDDIECRVIAGPAALRSRPFLVDQVLLPRQIARDRPDLFFATWYYAPFFCPAPKSIVAAWDISYTTHRSHYPFKEGLRLSFFSRWSCRRAQGVVTCSPFDGAQIAKHYGIEPGRICVLQLAPEDRFTPNAAAEDIARIRAKYGLPEKYLLSLGVISNRRNVGVIIDAFSDVCPDLPGLGLVVVGRDRAVPPVGPEARMAGLARAGRGRYLPWIDDEDLPLIYAGAWYYICTSTVDGETIMMKEAIKSGTPVITSPLMRDAVAGHAVIIDNPEDRAQTAALFREIASDPAARAARRQAGLEWVKALSWRQVARQSLEFLESR